MNNKKIKQGMICFCLLNVLTVLTNSANAEIHFDKNNTKYYNYKIYSQEEFTKEPESMDVTYDGNFEYQDVIYNFNGTDIHIKIGRNLKGVPYNMEIRDQLINQLLNTLDNIDPRFLDVIFGDGFNNYIELTEQNEFGGVNAASYKRSADSIKVSTNNYLYGSEAYYGTEILIHEMCHKLDACLAKMVLLDNGVTDVDASMYSKSPNWYKLFEENKGVIEPILTNGYAEIPSVVEFFAEVGTAYFCVPEKLKMVCPDAYNLFDKALNQAYELKAKLGKKL